MSPGKIYKTWKSSSSFFWAWCHLDSFMCLLFIINSLYVYSIIYRVFWFALLDVVNFNFFNCIQGFVALFFITVVVWATCTELSYILWKLSRSNGWQNLWNFNQCFLLTDFEILKATVTGPTHFSLLGFKNHDLCKANWYNILLLNVCLFIQ